MKSKNHSSPHKKSRAIANQPTAKSTSNNSFQDNRPEAVAQRKLNQLANSSPQVAQLSVLQAKANSGPAAPSLNKQNKNGGLPSQLKAGVEQLSGQSMDDVKVHYNSSKPAQLQAHAYAQGSEIHLASGQEKHLPHEAWHVAQQKQGRVKPTTQLQAKVKINDNPALEQEADKMGNKAMRVNMEETPQLKAKQGFSRTIQREEDEDTGPQENNAQVENQLEKDAEKSASAPTGPINAEPVTRIKKAGRISAIEMADKMGGADWAELKSRISTAGLSNGKFIKLCAEYILKLKSQQHSEAKKKFDEIGEYLTKEEASKRTMGEGSDKNRQTGFNLWSGAKEQAAEFAEKTGGVALETSITGGLFDGLNFGLEWNESLSYQWDQLSELYAGSIRGDLHIHQYRGVRGKSVFNRKEYPTIKPMIDIGLVNPVIHLYANWGQYSGLSWGTPVYGGGADFRKEEKTIEGASALNSFVNNTWEFGDSTELKGGYWPAGKGGHYIQKAGAKSKIREGEKW